MIKDNYLEPIKVRAALRSEVLKWEYRSSNTPDKISELDYTIMDALRKQIPQAIWEKHCIPNTEVWSGSCPGCDTRINKSFNKPYCRHCGQRIAWEDKEREVEEYGQNQSV